MFFDQIPPEKRSMGEVAGNMALAVGVLWLGAMVVAIGAATCIGMFSALEWCADRCLKSREETRRLAPR